MRFFGSMMTWSILAIGLFALLWTLMGGMRAVIWAGVIQFLIFLFGGLLALGCPYLRLGCTAERAEG